MRMVKIVRVMCDAVVREKASIAAIHSILLSSDQRELSSTSKYSSHDINIEEKNTTYQECMH